MTSVGLLCRQYLGAKRDNPMLVGGMDYLMKNLPDSNNKKHLLLVLRHASDAEHEQLRVGDLEPEDAQAAGRYADSRQEQLRFGSWDPANDAWGRHGGRVMQTALSCLTLEIYYRYLPLFKAEVDGGGDAGKQPKKAVGGK